MVNISHPRLTLPTCLSQPDQTCVYVHVANNNDLLMSTNGASRHFWQGAKELNIMEKFAGKK